MSSNAVRATKQKKQNEVKSQIETQLQAVLAPWKEELGEKKFKKRIKKAGKLFSKNLRNRKSKPSEKRKVASVSKKKNKAA